MNDSEFDFYETEGFEEAKNKALNILARRRYTKKELFEKLQKYEIEREAAEAAVCWADNYGFVNDFEYAKSYISDSVKIKKKGMAKIKYELYLKGVDKFVTEDAYEEIKNDFDMDEIIKSLIEKKLSDTKDRKQIDKTVRFLVSRGYEFSDIKRVLKDFTEETEFEEQ